MNINQKRNVVNRNKKIQKLSINFYNLLTIHSALSGQSISELENHFSGKGYGDLKGEVADVVVEYLKPIREKTLELLADESHLLAMLSKGAAKAQEVASTTLAKTYSNLGLVR
jgi:tryptophanyl-tRNA synthetase